jgi:hypothetical protein
VYPRRSTDWCSLFDGYFIALGSKLGVASWSHRPSRQALGPSRPRYGSEASRRKRVDNFQKETIPSHGTTGKAGGLREVERLKAARPFGRSSYAQSVSATLDQRSSPAPLGPRVHRPAHIRTAPGLLEPTGAAICRSVFASPRAIVAPFRTIPGIVKLWEPPRQSRGVSRSSRTTARGISSNNW